MNTFEIIYFFLNLCKKESVPNYLKNEALYQKLWYVFKRKINNFVCKKIMCNWSKKRTLFKLLYQKQNPTKKITLCV